MSRSSTLLLQLLDRNKTYRLPNTSQRFQLFAIRGGCFLSISFTPFRNVTHSPPSKKFCNWMVPMIMHFRESVSENGSRGEGELPWLLHSWIVDIPDKGIFPNKNGVTRLERQRQTLACVIRLGSILGDSEMTFRGRLLQMEMFWGNLLIPALLPLLNCVSFSPQVETLFSPFPSRD
ncbi:hypothetical protein TNCT_407771 [Trichonephila clavata]|uniref:Uncharacterized protein n=1 Tax=Trichonephila clavata TaxID=2740835 RepID=A0A8X6G8E3_TRICU|nr:hypothetical protein TNCT_407771 [Trichonephila clavata]